MWKANVSGPHISDWSRFTLVDAALQHEAEWSACYHKPSAQFLLKRTHCCVLNRWMFRPWAPQNLWLVKHRLLFGGTSFHFPKWNHEKKRDLQKLQRHDKRKHSINVLMREVKSWCDVEIERIKNKTMNRCRRAATFIILTGVSGSSENRFNLSSLLAERIPSSVSEIYCEMARRPERDSQRTAGCKW